MRIRTRLVMPFLAAAILALCGCAGAAPAASPSVPPIVHPTVWTITIENPAGDWRSCLDDTTVQTISNSAQRVVVTLRSSVTHETAQTDFDCVKQHLTGGTVALKGPAD